MIIYEEKEKKPNRYSLSTIKTVILFLTGYLGPKGLSFLYQYLAIAIFKDKIVANNTFTTLAISWINFAIYITLAIVLVLELYFFDKTNFKNRIKGFANSSSYVTALSFLGIYLISNFAYSLIRDFIVRQTGFQDTSSVNQIGINQMFDVNPVTISFMVVILAPIVEELTYRLGLFESIRRYNTTLGIVITTLFFALLHMDVLGLIMKPDLHNFLNELINFPGYILGGLILTLAYNKHLSISESMLTHAFINLLSVFAILLGKILPSNSIIFFCGTFDLNSLIYIKSIFNLL